LTSLNAMPALPASQCGFLTGALLSYTLNRAFTFRSAVAHRRALPRYILACGVGWGVNGASFALLTGVTGGIWGAQLGASAAVAIVSFLLQRVMVF
jgi:putative flippase GtrA